jgi:hypothetical protein
VVDCRSASARRQFTHRQSSPLTGIGSLAVSAAHQHPPDRSQENAVPQRGQVNARALDSAASANGFVMVRITISPKLSCLVHRLPQ